MEPLKMVERIQNRFFVCLKILARMLLAAMIVSASIHAAHAEIFFGERGLDEDEEEAPKVKKEMPIGSATSVQDIDWMPANPKIRLNSPTKKFAYLK